MNQPPTAADYAHQASQRAAGAWQMQQARIHAERAYIELVAAVILWNAWVDDIKATEAAMLGAEVIEPGDSPIYDAALTVGEVYIMARDGLADELVKLDPVYPEARRSGVLCAAVAEHLGRLNGNGQVTR